MKTVLSSLLAVVLACALVAPTSAQTGVDVRWTVAESDLYTVENNGEQPLVSFNDCLMANQTYTINFSVTVETSASYEAEFATTGEGTLNLIPQGFEPAGVSGTGTQTFNARGTFRARDVAFSNARDAFGVYLEGENGAVLGESFMTIEFDCIAQNGLPPTGASDVLGTSVPLGILASGLALLAGGYAVRRRYIADERAR
jgi:hypothetical protein